MDPAVLDRLRALTERDRLALFARDRGLNARVDRLGLTFAPGDRVVELATGQVWEVIDGKRINVVL